MSYKYEALMSPLKIGSITVKNRYAVGGMGAHERKRQCRRTSVS